MTLEPDTKALMAVPVETSPELKIGNPVRLLTEDDTGVIIDHGNSFDYAITPDENRFIVKQDLSVASDWSIALVENWVRLVE